MKENYTNFATSTLASPSPLTSTGLLFTVASGQGALFPTANFVVTIDTEILFISSRSGDSFTVLTRGFNGTIAASHSVGATVQNSVIQYSFDHLWQNQPDSYHPDIPPLHAGNTPSQWDNEFENLGSWTLYPTSLPGNAIFDAGVTMRSHLFVRRATTGDNQLYSAYIPFSPAAGTQFTVTAKFSEGINTGQNGGQAVESHLFVTDQTNPTSSPDSGNRVRMDTRLAANVSNGNITADTARIVRCSKNTNGVWVNTSSQITIASNSPVYLRLTFDGNNRWRGYYGDGFVFWQIADFTFTLSMKTLGLQFAAYSSGGNTVQHAAAVDWVRVVTGTSGNYNGL